uniref:Sugar phosphate transporter domain-containing protein n=1 Tax=Alexandrium andersonii TaxID=327968 RepID=A0A7S2E0A5_9DINO
MKSAGYKLNPLSSMKIFSPLIMILLGTALVVLDPSALDIEKIAEVGWGPFALNGMVACGLNLAVFLVIKIASGLIFALSGVLKDFLIITGSAVFKGETISTMQMGGYVIAVLGLQMYAAVSKAPADFEAGVLPELFRRIKELVMPPATSGDGVKKKDVAAAKEEELQGIIGATTDNEEEDPKQNVFKTDGDALDDDQP